MRAPAGVVGILALVLAGCAAMSDYGRDPGRALVDTTYEKFLARAQTGDAESQNLIGVMLFFGEGVPRNRFIAHWWFHKAADQGNARAQRNLAIMHYLGAGVPRDDVEAERCFRLAAENEARAAGRRRTVRPYASIADLVEHAARTAGDRRPGESTYAALCAGCHGLNGISAYVGSPSFAIGERMDRSDAVLLRSLMKGIGDMPGWEDKLPRKDLVDILRFVRSFEPQYDTGILQVLRAAPELYFLFGPMRSNNSAYRKPEDDEMERALRPVPEMPPARGIRVVPASAVKGAPR